MTIKSDKFYHFWSVGILIWIIFVSVGCVLEYNDSLGFIILLPSVLLIRYWVAIGRKFTLSETGCTVQFLCWKRFYLWSDFKTKRVEYVGDCGGPEDRYSWSAFFSKRCMKQPLKLKPTAYSTFFQPFSFVFLHFDFELPNNKGHIKDHENIYVVDEELFRAKMREWNVPLEEWGGQEKSL